MTENVHDDNDSPTASDDDVKRMDADTEQDAAPGAAVDEQGAGNAPTEPDDAEENEDPKSGQSAV